MLLLLRCEQWIVELLVCVQEMFGFTIQSSETSALMSLFLNLVILLSYPLNFFIYCAMSSQFRDTFRALFTGDGAGTGASSRSSSTHRQASSRLGVGRGSSQHQAGGGGVGGGNSSQYVCLQDSDTPLVGGRGNSRTNVTLV